MAISVYQCSVAPYKVALTAFLQILEKAEAYAEAKKFDPANYLTLRLKPDMMNFTRQVQSFCDHAKNSTSRVAGITPPRFEDKEASLAELKGRIEKTLQHLETIDVAALDAGFDREVELPLGPRKAKMRGDNYLLHFALPNFYFHLTTAYDILREAGVEIGKRDFLGAVPGFQLI